MDRPRPVTVTSKGAEYPPVASAKAPIHNGLVPPISMTLAYWTA